MTHTYRTISWICTGAVIVYYVSISFVPFGWRGALPAAIVMGLIVIALMRPIQNRPRFIWKFVGSEQQISRVFPPILALLTVHIVLVGVLRAIGLSSTGLEIAIQLFVWIILPVFGALSGMLALPRRDREVRSKKTFTVYVAAIILAFMFGLMLTLPLAPRSELASPSRIVMEVGYFSALATSEEIIFRMIMLTAIMQMSGSRWYALIISSTAFGLAHLPIAMLEPVVNADPDQLVFYLKSFAPELVWKIGIGFILGALWIRTGSLVLVALAHAIINVVPAIYSGSLPI
ncbi:MAG: CPBP family intramembrane metalloprotease [Brevundimonas sp.]|uniref:CPBP family intramembrane glutamic endopeptidase n=1 Tax=Brevundimonas sp. TaxID=1871086 RepID=UPI002723669D|nr:CPBP family intramembrane glutamic endopeptidase [Brevundimonas sp.]MDO9077292.1 CPBP family intramembrane metalloprotease [Brevundimonas sp.]MDP3081151.1 CPBP family intramembrane metalloprotease [Brevundimonas sp.]MDZ4062181.1 CPBP family intramembrane glutamic endopeptidase [Brevundimonas sp.]